MTGIDLDLAGIRARAEAAMPGPWQAEPQCGRGAWIKSAKTGAWTALSCGDDDLDGAANAAHIASADPPTVIAMCDLIERQAGEIARLKAVVDRAQIPVASLRDDLALRMSAIVAEIAVENGTTPAEVLGSTLVFLRRANEQRRAALTPQGGHAMSDSMIERGVRAVLLVELPQYADDALWADHWEWYLRSRGQGGSADYSTLAIGERQFRATVEALREPTEAMQREGFRNNRHVNPTSCGKSTCVGAITLPPVKAYQAMIDTILAEGQPASPAPATEGGHG